MIGLRVMALIGYCSDADGAYMQRWETLKVLHQIRSVDDSLNTNAM